MTLRHSIISIAAFGFGIAPAQAQDAQVLARGRTAFQVCAACHATQPGMAKNGPTLAGVAGRRAGAVKGYTYSPALAQSGITWSDDKLNQYLANPRGTVPGTKMIFRGIDDPAKRQAIIAYLKSLPK